VEFEFSSVAALLVLFSEFSSVAALLLFLAILAPQQLGL
jgi:hypothetical protein